MFFSLCLSHLYFICLFKYKPTINGGGNNYQNQTTAPPPQPKVKTS